MLQFNPSIDVLYTRSENLRRVRDTRRLDRDAQLRRKLQELTRPTGQHRKPGWRRPFYPAGA